MAVVAQLTDRLARQRQIISWAIMAIVIALVAAYLPQGFDFAHVFGPHSIPIFYVPWTDGVMYFLPWPILVSITITALVIAVQRHRGSLWLIILAIFSLPTIWVLLLGQLEGVALLGLLLMPWSVPARLLERLGHRDRRWWIGLAVFIAATTIGALLIRQNQGALYYHDVSLVLGQQPAVAVGTALLLPFVVPMVLIKPQLMAFTLLAKRSWIMVMAMWIALSLLIWGGWPSNLLVKVVPEIRVTQPQNVALFPWSLVIALPMLWLSHGDPEMLMATGNFVSPSVLPYHYMTLMPGLARMPIGYALLCWISSFLPLTANYFGPQWWMTANIFPLLVWIGLWRQHRTQKPLPANALLM